MCSASASPATSATDYIGVGVNTASKPVRSRRGAASNPMEVMSMVTVSTAVAEQLVRETVEEANRNELIVIIKMRDAAVRGTRVV